MSDRKICVEDIACEIREAIENALFDSVTFEVQVTFDEWLDKDMHTRAAFDTRILVHGLRCNYLVKSSIEWRVDRLGTSDWCFTHDGDETFDGDDIGILGMVLRCVAGEP